MKGRVVVGLAAVAALSFVGVATAGTVTDPVDIRVEMDLPSMSAGPRVFLVEGVTAGPGPELTGADEVDNPSEWCGDLAVDIDPDAQTITVGPDTEGGCFFELVTVEITTSQIASVEVASGDLVPGGGAELGTAVFPTGVVLTWTLDEESPSFLPSGTVVFSYELAEVDDEVDDEDGEDEDGEDEDEGGEAGPAEPVVADPTFTG